MSVNTDNPPNFYNLNFAEVEEYLIGLGEKKFRAQQLFRWVYGLGVTDPEAMTNLSKKFRESLPQIFEFKLPLVVSDLISTDGTRKFLFDMGSGKTVETVVIPSGERFTLCVSSEVGCNLACRFCFTGKQKLQRRLETWEILGQFIVANRLLPEDQKLTNVVFMGMGEPLDNPEAVFKTVENLNNTWGINFSRKKVTISTVGLVPMIPKVTASGARLAVSLNAPNDEIRSQIMPINHKWPITKLLAACAQHSEESGDLVTLEYVLLKGVTDSLENARELHRLTKGLPCKINIIPFNEHPGSDFQRPAESQVVKFQKELMRLGTHVLRRRTMGRDIFAACGQLTSAFEKHPVRMEALKTKSAEEFVHRPN